VAALDGVATAGRLLEQAYAGEGAGSPPAALRAGIDAMLRSLQALERSLTRQATAGKKRRAPWQRRPLPTSARAGGKPHDRRD
jgi:hypothetical protein